MLNKVLLFEILLIVLLHVRKIDTRLRMYWQPEPALVWSQIWITCYGSYTREINWYINRHKVAVSYLTYTRNFGNHPYRNRCNVEDLIHFDVSARLVLKPIIRSDHGIRFYCRYGSSYVKSLRIDVYASISYLRINRYLGFINFVVGSPITLQCIADDVKPKPNLRWYRSEGGKKPYLMSSGGVMKIENLTYGFFNAISERSMYFNARHHGGKIYCSGENKYGSTKTSRIYRLVKLVNVETVHISNNVSGNSTLFEVKENATVNIYCSANRTDPKSVITFWELRPNGQKKILYSTKKTFRDHGLLTTVSMLQITPDRRMDGFKVYCHGRNIFDPYLNFPGKISQMVVVEILHAPYNPPRFSGINGNQYVFVNDKVKVYCSWRGGNPEYAEVVLRCPGNYPVSDITTVGKFMTISKMMHGKNCQCIGVHKYKTISVRSTQVFNVSFRSLVNMTSTTSKIQGRRHSNITCYIQTDGNPPEYIFRPWEHWWGKIHLRTLSGTSHPRFTEIVSFSSSLQDSGTYKCTVTNGNAQTGRIFFQSSELKMKIPSKPVIALQRFTFKAAEGADALLSLKFYSYPNYSSITWLKVNSKINPEYHFVIENVVKLISYNKIVKSSGFKALAVIQQLSLDDFGKYRVNISNAEGWVTQTVVILLTRREPEAIVGVAGDLPVGIPIAAFFVGILLTVGVAVITRYIYRRILLKQIAEHEEEED